MPEDVKRGQLPNHSHFFDVSLERAIFTLHYHAV